MAHLGPTMTQPIPTRLTQVPLACRAAYAVADVVVNDVIAASVYERDDPVIAGLSEQSATSSPAKAFLTATSSIWPVLMISFGPDVSGPGESAPRWILLGAGGRTGRSTGGCPVSGTPQDGGAGLATRTTSPGSPP
jgi:hypothetical protein